MHRPSPEQLARYAEHFSNSAALKAFGVRVSFPDGDRVHAVIDPVRPEQRGGLGMEAVNGGVLAAMFDLVIGCAGALVDPTKRTATMQLSMSFERPVLGHKLLAVAKIDSAGKTTLFASAHIEDEDGKVCARCQGLVKLSQVPWKSGVSPGIG